MDYTALSLAQQWALVVGLFLPLVIALLVQTQWSAETKHLAAFGVCVLVATGTLAVRGQLNPDNLVGTVFVIVLSAEATYQKVWKPLGIAPMIERATNVSISAPAEPPAPLLGGPS